MAYTTRNTVNRLARKESCTCGTRTTKGERNLYIELQKHKLGQIAARNKRISLDKRNIFLEVKLAVSEEKRRRANVIPVKRIYLLYLQTVQIIAGPSVTIKNESKQHVHSKRHILSLKSKFLEILKHILQ